MSCAPKVAGSPKIKTATQRITLADTTPKVGLFPRGEPEGPGNCPFRPRSGALCPQSLQRSLVTRGFRTGRSIPRVIMKPSEAILCAYQVAEKASNLKSEGRSQKGEVGLIFTSGCVFSSLGGTMTRKRNLVVGAALLVALGLLLIGQIQLEKVVAAQAKGAQAPRFEVDPFWPKPLPKHWLLGMTIGVSVDSKDHIWIIHRSSATLNNNERGAERNPPTGECCKGAPPVLEFDQAGNLVSSWGGPGQGYEWPQSNHGITVDGKGMVWIGGNAAVDGQVLKFTSEGKFVKQFGFGYANAGSNDK